MASGSSDLFLFIPAPLGIRYDAGGPIINNQQKNPELPAWEASICNRRGGVNPLV
jgi:hypothetical protein